MLPQKTPSRTSSQIIQAFTLARQELELEEEKSHFAIITENTEKRRGERHVKFPAKKKKKG